MEEKQKQQPVVQFAEHSSVVVEGKPVCGRLLMVTWFEGDLVDAFDWFSHQYRIFEERSFVDNTGCSWPKDMMRDLLAKYFQFRVFAFGPTAISGKTIYELANDCAEEYKGFRQFLQRK